VFFPSICLYFLPHYCREGDEEETYRRAIEQEKVVYKESFEALRVLKPEIEHIKKMLEKSRVTLQSQFDQVIFVTQYPVLIRGIGLIP